MGSLPGDVLSGGSFFWNFGYIDESRESPISEFGISRNDFGESIEGFSFCVLENDLLTSMGANRILSETLKRFYTLVYSEGQESWGWEYLCFEKLLWGIQAMTVIIKEGLDWWFLDRMSRNDIFTTRF